MMAQVENFTLKNIVSCFKLLKYKFIFQAKKMGAEEMAQWVICLLCTHES